MLAVLSLVLFLLIPTSYGAWTECICEGFETGTFDGPSTCSQAWLDSSWTLGSPNPTIENTGAAPYVLEGSNYVKLWPTNNNVFEAHLYRSALLNGGHYRMKFILSGPSGLEVSAMAADTFRIDTRTPAGTGPWVTQSSISINGGAETAQVVDLGILTDATDIQFICSVSSRTQPEFFALDDIRIEIDGACNQTNPPSPSPTSSPTLAGTCQADTPCGKATVEYFESGTYLIPMDYCMPGSPHDCAQDHTDQLSSQPGQNSGDGFNMKVYGLLVNLLWGDIPLHWVIKDDKNWDQYQATERDIFKNVSMVYPTSGPNAMRAFYGGVFAIAANLTIYADPIIQSWNEALPHNRKINIYVMSDDQPGSADPLGQLLPIRVKLTTKPYVGVLDSGGLTYIMMDFMTRSGLVRDYDLCNSATCTASDDWGPGGCCENRLSRGEGPAHFRLLSGSDFINSTNLCVTMAAEPHFASASTALPSAAKKFLSEGGNFLTQCAGIKTYENCDEDPAWGTSTICSEGRMLSTAGLKLNLPESKMANEQYRYLVGEQCFMNPGVASTPIAQFDGRWVDGAGAGSSIVFSFVELDTGELYSPDNSGGFQWSWPIINNMRSGQQYYITAQGRFNVTSAAKGHNLVFMAGHNYGKDDPDGFKGTTGARMVMNTVLLPSNRPASCNLEIDLYKWGPTPEPTLAPSASPSLAPTPFPTATPTTAPTSSPTIAPSPSPTKSPTNSPTNAPTGSPTKAPTKSPTNSPTNAPTGSPTKAPTTSPTSAPTYDPSAYCSVVSACNDCIVQPDQTDVGNKCRWCSQTAAVGPGLCVDSLAPACTSLGWIDILGVCPTRSPTQAPTGSPSFAPTMAPSFPPTVSPTSSPSFSPTPNPPDPCLTCPSGPWPVGESNWCDCCYYDCQGAKSSCFGSGFCATLCRQAKYGCPLAATTASVSSSFGIQNTVWLSVLCPVSEQFVNDTVCEQALSEVVSNPSLAPFNWTREWCSAEVFSQNGANLDQETVDLLKAYFKGQNSIAAVIENQPVQLNGGQLFVVHCAASFSQSICVNQTRRLTEDQGLFENQIYMVASDCGYQVTGPVDAQSSAVGVQMDLEGIFGLETELIVQATQGSTAVAEDEIVATTGDSDSTDSISQQLACVSIVQDSDCVSSTCRLFSTASPDYCGCLISFSECFRAAESCQSVPFSPQCNGVCESSVCSKVFSVLALSSPESPGPGSAEQNWSAVGAIAGVAAALAMLIGLLIWFFTARKRRQLPKEESHRQQESEMATLAYDLPPEKSATLGYDLPPEKSGNTLGTQDLANFSAGTVGTAGLVSRDDELAGHSAGTVGTADLVDVSPAKSSSSRKKKKKNQGTMGTIALAGGNDSSGTVGTVILTGASYDLVPDDGANDSSGTVDTSWRSSSKRKKRKTPRQQRPYAPVDASDVKKFEELGQGAFGAVYRGEWRGLAVAIKECKSLDEKQQSALLDEANGMKAIKAHKNIVAFYDICRMPELGIIVELCKNGSLDDALYGPETRRRKFTAEQKQALCIGLVRGLHHLRCEKVVHRDIAARNVLLDEYDVAKIADFGLSRVAGSGEAGKEYTMTKIGPIRWMAPEQLSKQQYSFASDLWACAVVFGEIYAERTPFEGQTNIAVAQQVLAGGHLPVPVPDTPAIVGNAMIQCFEFEPTDRPTALQLLNQFTGTGVDWSSLYLNLSSSSNFSSEKVTEWLADEKNGLRSALLLLLTSATKVEPLLQAMISEDGIDSLSDLPGVSISRLQGSPYHLNARDAKLVVSLAEKVGVLERKMKKRRAKSSSDK